MKKKFTVRVNDYSYEGGTAIGFEIPEDFLEAMDLKLHEVLEWEVDTETKITTITKTNTVVSQ